MSLRHPAIMSIARRDGRVSVDGLVAALGVTPQTIRRDLSELAASGQLTRVHGGAVLPSGTVNLAWQDRRALSAEAKAAIATAAAARIAPGSSLFLNIGTTTEAVAHALAGHTDLLVVTNNLNVAHTLADAHAEVIVTAGRLRPADAGLVGELAAETVSQFRPDWAVIGCSALDPSGDLMDYDLAEISVAQRMLTYARRTMLVADAEKLTRTAPLRIAPLARLDIWVTDKPPPAEIAAACAASGTEILNAPSSGLCCTDRLEVILPLSPDGIIRRAP